MEKTGADERLIRRIVEDAREVFGNNLVGAYLHGSAVMGCYHPEKSDIDFIVVLMETPDDACKREYMDRIMALDFLVPGKGVEMSVVRRQVCRPFIYPTPYELHYSRGHLAWYTKDPEDYIRKMKGTDKDLAAHFTVIRSRGRCLWGLPIQEVFDEVPEEAYMDSLWYDIEDARENITEDSMYLILNLARVLGFQAEGKVLSKAEGGCWGLENLPKQYHPLIRKALQEYEENSHPFYDPALAGEYAAYMLEKIRSRM